MDVSRITAVSPKQIDWRKLTAKEIIKYETQGVEVPTQYLQWAKEFQNDLNSRDKDDTTYETAVISGTNINSQPNETINETEEPPTEGIPEEEPEGTPKEEPEKTVAQQKRENMQNDGDSLIKQAIVFIGDSTNSSKETRISEALISSIENASTNEIEALENYMADLLSKAEEKQNEFKNEISKLNNDNSDQASFARINQLQEELRKYGTQGQTKIATIEGVLSGYDTIMNDQTPIIDNAKDFGTETTNIGNDLLQKNRSFNFIRILEWLFGKLATDVGTSTVKQAESTEGVQNQAIDTNSDNLQNLSGLKNEVESKTGVKAEASPDNSQRENKSDNKNKSEETDKTIQDNTDANFEASINIDEILKRKIRKGENIENTSTT